MVKLIDNNLTCDLMKKAAGSERLRSHHNLHQTLDEDVHRLVMAVKPGSFVAPHRHPGKWELFAILSGKIKVKIYNPDGSVREEYVLKPAGDLAAMEISEGEFHAFEALTDSVVLEVKKGPYVPPPPEDILKI